MQKSWYLQTILTPVRKNQDSDTGDNQRENTDCNKAEPSKQNAADKNPQLQNHQDKNLEITKFSPTVPRRNR